MMVAGIGTDILKISRLTPETLQEGDPFFKMTYTDSETKQAKARINPLYYYATRFAGKEAVFKALGLPPDGIHLNEIEILAREDGSPAVTLHGRLKRLAEKRGISHILLSLSYDTDYAVAYAIAVKNEGNM